MRKLYSRTSFHSVLGAAAAAAALLAIQNGASAQVVPGTSPEEAFVSYGFLGNPGLVSFDISWVDPDNRLYFLADRSNQSVDIIPIGPNPVKLPIFSLNRLVPTGTDNGFAGTGAGCSSGTATDCAGPNGVMTFVNPKSGQSELWVGDGPTTNPTACDPLATCSTVKVFTVAGGTTPTHVISTGGNFRADELCFDPTDHIVAIANDADHPPFVSLIDTDTYKVTAKIPFDGSSGNNLPRETGPKATNGLEQCQWNGIGPALGDSKPTGPTSAILINVPEVNGPGDDTEPGHVVVIDPTAKTNFIVGDHQVDISECAGPQGMAVDLYNERVLLGCNAASIGGPFDGIQNSVIVSLEDATDFDDDDIGGQPLPNHGGADEVWFNPGANFAGIGHYFLALGSHDPQLLGTVDSETGLIDADAFVGSASSRHQHSVAADSVTNMVGMPISEVGAGFSSTLCGSSAAQGCIAIFGPNLFDDEGNEPSE